MGQVREIVTLGPALAVRTQVTEVTSTSLSSAVQFVADAPEESGETFLACPCFNGNGKVPRVSRVDGCRGTLHS